MGPCHYFMNSVSALRAGSGLESWASCLPNPDWVLSVRLDVAALPVGLVLCPSALCGSGVG